jgi:quercetin dioxygenase-like cupin family protein
MRLLVTGKETDNAFAVVTTGGTYDKPIGFHYHREAHDVFLCLKGSMNVWADDQARELREGDFASVPPVSAVSFLLPFYFLWFLLCF